MEPFTFVYPDGSTADFVFKGTQMTNARETLPNTCPCCGAVVTSTAQPVALICPHGQLSRQCELCERDTRIADLERENARLKERLGLRGEIPDGDLLDRIEELQGENARLREVVERVSDRLSALMRGYARKWA